jgi:hypothetical protein
MALALPGVLDQIHRRHGAIYQTIDREQLVIRPQVVQVITHLNRARLASHPMWKHYIEELPRMDRARLMTASHDDQVAFWLNFRNTAMMAALLRMPRASGGNYRLADLKNWQEQTLNVAGETRSLTYAEARLQELGEPEVIFGLCTGTETSPPWPSGPFTTNGWRDRLRENGKAWLANPKVFRVDHNRKIIYISQQFLARLDWIRSLEPQLSLDSGLRVYPKDQALILALISPAIPEDDRRQIQSARYRVFWIEESDLLLIR